MYLQNWPSWCFLLTLTTLITAEDDDYNIQQRDGSFQFGYNNPDSYHHAAGNRNNVVRGEFGGRNPETGRIDSTEYTAGPRGYRPRGKNVHRKYDLNQNGPRPIGSKDDPYFDPHEDPSYNFEFKTRTYNRKESANRAGDVNGRYNYIDDVGELHNVEFVAGKNTGFHVKTPFPDSNPRAYYGRLFYRGRGKPIPRGRTSIQRGLDGSYRFVSAGPDQRRTETSDSSGHVRGSYTYLDDKGVQHSVHYIAGPETGYRVLKNVKGPHLPTVYPFGTPEIIPPDFYDHVKDDFFDTAASGHVKPIGGSGGGGSRPNKDDGLSEFGGDISNSGEGFDEDNVPAAGSSGGSGGSSSSSDGGGTGTGFNRPTSGGGSGNRPSSLGEGTENRPSSGGGTGNRPASGGATGNRPPSGGGIGNRPSSGGFNTRPPSGGVFNRPSGGDDDAGGDGDDGDDFLFGPSGGSKPRPTKPSGPGATGGGGGNSIGGGVGGSTGSGGSGTGIGSIGGSGGGTRPRPGGSTDDGSYKPGLGNTGDDGSYIPPGDVNQDDGSYRPGADESGSVSGGSGSPRPGGFGGSQFGKPSRPSRPGAPSHSDDYDDANGLFGSESNARPPLGGRPPVIQIQGGSGAPGCERCKGTIVTNVGDQPFSVPPGVSVRAHVQSIDLLPVLSKVPSPSEQYKEDMSIMSEQLNSAASDIVTNSTNITATESSRFTTTATPEVPTTTFTATETTTLDE